MKNLITSLMVAALMAAPIGCDSAPESDGSGGSGGSGASTTTDKDAAADVDPETGKTLSEADIMQIQGPGGEADPDAPINAKDGGK